MWHDLNSFAVSGCGGHRGHAFIPLLFIPVTIASIASPVGLCLGQMFRSYGGLRIARPDTRMGDSFPLLTGVKYPASP